LRGAEADVILAHEEPQNDNTNSVYATSDTGELDGTGERVALMLQPRHTCSWVGDIPFRFIDSVQLAGSASTTHLYNDYDAIRDR